MTPERYAVITLTMLERAERMKIKPVKKVVNGDLSNHCYDLQSMAEEMRLDKMYEHCNDMGDECRGDE